MKKNFFYIADFSLPNKSAYSLHVLKICDAFNEINKKKILLLLPHVQNDYKNTKIKKDFLLKFFPSIKFFYSTKKRLNLFGRIFFSFKLVKYLKYKKCDLIISRSIVPSLILAVFNIKNVLEIHTELTGFTKYFFLLSKIKFVSRNIKFIFINDYLRKKFSIKKEKSIILYDAVNHLDFKPSYKKTIKNTCFYSGSFAKGKGLEIILKVSKKLPNINFHLYGNKDTLYKNKNLEINQKNIFFKGYLTYSKLVKVIDNYKVLLMPYKNKVGVLIKNINVVKYFSPLKMFDYMASGKIIIASDLPVYKNILINNVNSIVVRDNIKLWSKKINQCIKSNKFNHLGKEARNNSKRYSWKKRVIKIIEFNEK